MPLLKHKLISTLNNTMFSRDVKSRFNNVSIQEILERLEKRLREFNYSFSKAEEILN